mmetsp:Transcript_1951/g.2196  ORF Transcript_1951/g.2196 Transcript_1951/m.2196 type:complete len:532 (+) Transcript_1951:125-1720(+)
MAEGENDPLTLFKNFYSTCLLIFSAICIHGLMLTNQTGLSKDGNSYGTIFLFWAAIIWLAMIEGGQASHVGLAPVGQELYKESHPVSYKIAEHCNKGANLDRYLLGRQFGVIFVVFCVNLSGGPIGTATLWNMPEWVIQVFFKTGFSMILFTCMVGQLNTQVNASICMLDFINNYFSLFTYWGCIFVEFTGFVHFSYAISMIVHNLAGQQMEQKEPAKEGFDLLFFWTRVLFSFGILSFSLIITIAALFEGKTTMWDSVPKVISVILFFGLMSVVGMLEGMQIAFFGVAKLTEEERGNNKWALSTCDILYNRRNGLNLPGFMIGRQLTVVTCFFVVARVTTQNVGDDEKNVMGISDGLQGFLNLGFQGALITTILASISWQLVAGAFPVAFLSTPVTYVLLRICLFLEGTGICNGAWVLAAIHKSIAGFQRDEVYIGTAEERRSRGMKDNSKREIDMPALSGFSGVNLPGFRSAPKSLRDLAESDPAVKEYMNEVAKDMSKGSSSGGGISAPPASAPPASYGGGDDDEVEA